MQRAKKGWKSINALLKLEGKGKGKGHVNKGKGVVNTGLDNGKALDTFNNIVKLEELN